MGGKLVFLPGEVLRGLTASNSESQEVSRGHSTLRVEGRAEPGERKIMMEVDQRSAKICTVLQ